MNKENNSYQPIDCNFYDRLEAWATTRKSVTIEYLSGSLPSIIHGVIITMFIKDKVEFLTLENGVDIRLDSIIAVDGIVMPNQC